jgi:hypothetical protein
MVGQLRADSITGRVMVFGAHSLGMGLVVSAVSVTVALDRTSRVTPGSAGPEDRETAALLAARWD